MVTKENSEKNIDMINDPELISLFSELGLPVDEGLGNLLRQIDRRKSGDGIYFFEINAPTELTES